MEPGVFYARWVTKYILTIPKIACCIVQREIKMAKSHSKKYTDEKQWDHRRRNTISTKYAHGCEMHGSNTPGNPD